MSYPSIDDLEGWRRAQQASEAFWEPVVAQILSQYRCRVDAQGLAGVATYLCMPPT